MKNKRQEKILEFIKNENIDTQDGLLMRLKEHGFEVTQATVSRDIKELKLVKVATGEGGYKYAARDENDLKQTVKYLNIMKETVVSLKCANNIIVVKTYTGMAQAACAAIDAVYHSRILGSIAGDDTIFIALESSDLANGLVGEINSKIDSKKK